MRVNNMAAVFFSGMVIANLASASNLVVKAIPFESYREVSSLAPKLFATFNIDCNQKFLKVLREDIADTSIDKMGVNIAVGALVVEDESLDCIGAPTPKEVAVGVTFSGRRYAVTSFKK